MGALLLIVLAILILPGFFNHAHAQQPPQTGDEITLTIIRRVVNTQDAAIALAKSRGDTLIFLYVCDLEFLDKTAAPMVVDAEGEVCKMGDKNYLPLHPQLVPPLELRVFLLCGVPPVASPLTLSRDIAARS